MNEKMLVLENGKVYYGKGFGSQNTRIAEIVFNTSMVGYQEILSDAAYCGQMVVMSYPLIGNYGLTDEDYESKGIYLSGFIVREYNDNPSNFRFTKTLGEVMNDNGVAGISGVDTREIVRVIRDEGSMLAMITDADRNIEECLIELKNYKSEERPVEKVGSKKIWFSRTRNPINTIVAVDCGIRLNMIKRFNQMSCNVVIVPFNTSIETIKKYNPSGLYISNGPGNPEELTEVVELVKALRGTIPMFGVGLGSQIIALAYGAKIEKMKYGHRGGNHPVLNLINNKVEITSQNHTYAVDKKSLENTGLNVTHVNILDNEVEGMIDNVNNVFASQYAPESASRAEDSGYIYNEFMLAMKAVGGNGNAEENRY